MTEYEEAVADMEAARKVWSDALKAELDARTRYEIKVRHMRHLSYNTAPKEAGNDDAK